MKKNSLSKILSLIFLAYWIFGGTAIFTDFSFAKYSSVISIAIFFGIIYLSNTLSNGESTVFNPKVVEKKVCPVCHESMDATDEYCSECGVNTVKTLECDYCSHMNSSDSTKCENCGAMLV